MTTLNRVDELGRDVRAEVSASRAAVYALLGWAVECADAAGIDVDTFITDYRANQVKARETYR